MQIAIIGGGYVGLTTAACLAELGHSVAVVDIDSDRIALLQRGVTPIYEPGLCELMAKNARLGRLTFSTELGKKVSSAAAIFIAVGTPAAADGSTDLSYVAEAAGQLAPHASADAVIVIKSTVPAGTARRVETLVATARDGRALAMASNPEFLREGSAITDFLTADRIVIGADSPHARARLVQVYEPLRARGVPIVVTSTVNAELIKYASNAFLAMKIGFINDMADLCEAAGADVSDVARGIGLDRRIGPAFLSPGPGFGGSCFPKDTRSLARTGRDLDRPQVLVETLIELNERRKRDLAHRIARQVRPGGSVAVLGVAFKGGTDDVRDSAALTIIPLLQRAGLKVRAHDPQARQTGARVLKSVEWCNCPYEACDGADLAVILTEWDEYRDLDLRRLAAAMAGRTIMDLRNLLPAADVARHGLRYVSLGRPALDPHEDKAGGALMADRVAAAPA